MSIYIAKRIKEGDYLMSPRRVKESVKYDFTDSEDKAIHFSSPAGAFRQIRQYGLYPEHFTVEKWL